MVALGIELSAARVSVEHGQPVLDYRDVCAYLSRRICSVSFPAKLLQSRHKKSPASLMTPGFGSAVGFYPIKSQAQKMSRITVPCWHRQLLTAVNLKSIYVEVWQHGKFFSLVTKRVNVFVWIVRRALSQMVRSFLGILENEFRAGDKRSCVESISRIITQVQFAYLES